MIPRICVITPSFNQGRFIQRTIDSVLSQNAESLEYHVIDGGSTDETVDILRRHEGHLTWVSEKDQGLPDAINKGIRTSSAPIIGWLNSDDIYYAGTLNKVLEFFEQNPDIGVVYGDANHIDAEDRFIERYPTEPWNFERLKDICFISQPAAFVRRSVFERYGLMDLSIKQSQDYELWLRLGKQGVRFGYLPHLLSATRLHDEAFTIRSRLKCHHDVNRIMIRHFGRVPDKWIFNYAHAKVDGWGISRAHRVRFAWVVSLVSIQEALRWNRRVSRQMLNTTTTWCWSPLQACARTWNPLAMLGMSPSAPVIEGLYGDGWTSENVRFSIAPSLRSRKLMAQFFVPPGHPAESVTVKLENHLAATSSVTMARGGEGHLEALLPRSGGTFQISVSPAFQPNHVDSASADGRTLGCKYVAFSIA